jgi:hypothetical protein
MSFLCQFISLGGVLHRLPGMFVGGHMVFLVVMRCGNAVRVRGQIVKLRGSAV